MKHTSLFSKSLFCFLIAALAMTGMAVADQWIHVEVENPRDGETVKINLPFSLMSAAVAMIPEDVRMDGELRIDDLDMDWQELMALWNEIKDAPDATFVTVESRDETVVVKKSGEYVLIKTTESTEHGADVDVKFPLAVVDALLSGPEGTFDFEAALQALSDYGPGELVTVRDGDETVKVWIDNQNEAD